MLHQGLPVDQIGIALRHCGTDTTAYYAKGDVALLNANRTAFGDGDETMPAVAFYIAVRHADGLKLVNADYLVAPEQFVFCATDVTLLRRRQSSG